MEGGIFFAMHGRSRMTLGARRGTVLLLSYVCELLFFHSGSPPLHEKNVTRHIYTHTNTHSSRTRACTVCRLLWCSCWGRTAEGVVTVAVAAPVAVAHNIYMRWREHTSSNSKVRTDKATQSDK